MARWHRLEPGRRHIALWLGASALSDLTEYSAGPAWHDTQLIARVWFVVSVVLGVAALAAYQHSAHRAAILRAVGGGYVVVWVMLAVTIEPIDRYSTYSGPLQGIVLLGAAVTTLFRRVAVGRRDLLADPGFLIAVALCAIAIPAAFETVVAQFWLNAHLDMANSYYAMNNIVSGLAAILVISALRLPGGRSTEQFA